MLDDNKPMITIILRGITVLLLLIAAIVMFVCHQRVTVDEQLYHFTLTYKHWNAFMIFAIVNIIVSTYNLAIVFIPMGSQLWKTVILLDMMMNMMVGGISLGAAWQTYLLIKDGNMLVGWQPLCWVIAHFCNQALASLITSTVGFFFAFCLLLWSLHVSVDPFLILDA